MEAPSPPSLEAREAFQARLVAMAAMEVSAGEAHASPVDAVHQTCDHGDEVMHLLWWGTGGRRGYLELAIGETVHLTGVDRPETKDPCKPMQSFGKEASALTQRLVDGKRVRPEYDQQRQDTYGRTLAYV
jgi:hypothetical protein